MIISEIFITKNTVNPVDYNIKAEIYDDTNTKIGDFGVDGIDMFTWWAKQDEEFRLKVLNQFIAVMAQEIISGNAE